MERQLAAALAVASALLVASAAHAQSGAPLPAPRFGVVAGVNSSTIAGSAVDDGEVERRTGFVGGVYLNFPLGATLSVQPELLYTTKGANAGEGSDPADFHQDYVEVPLLLRADFAAGSPVRPYLFAGPTLAYRVRCEFEIEGVTVGCDELTDTPGEDVPEFKKLDLGAAVGGGITLGVGTAARLNLGARYTLGVVSIIDPVRDTSEDEIRNRVLSFTAGLEIPLGRR